MNIHDIFFSDWGVVAGAIVGLLGAALGGYCGIIRNTTVSKEQLFVRKVAVRTYVGLVVFLGLLFGLGFVLRAEPGTEFPRSGDPALKLEVRRASTKEIDGWKPSTEPGDPQEEMPLCVSPDVELSNEDVLSTGVEFEPLGKAVSRWKTGSFFLAVSIVFFVAWWRDKQRWCAVVGVIALLVGVGSLIHGLTSSAERFDQRGMWQVVMRFNDTGTKKLSDLTTNMLDGRTKQTMSDPSIHLAFLIDGELTFVAPVWGQNTEGIYYLVQAHAMDSNWQQSGLSKEDATRIAKGIVSP